MAFELNLKFTKCLYMLDVSRQRITSTCICMSTIYSKTPFTFSSFCKLKTQQIMSSGIISDKAVIELLATSIFTPIIIIFSNYTSFSFVKVIFINFTQKSNDKKAGLNIFMPKTKLKLRPQQLYWMHIALSNSYWCTHMVLYAAVLLSFQYFVLIEFSVDNFCVLASNICLWKNKDNN